MAQSRQRHIGPLGPSISGSPVVDSPAVVMILFMLKDSAPIPEAYLNDMLAGLSDDEKTAFALVSWHFGAHRNEFPFRPVVNAAEFQELDYGDATCQAVWRSYGSQRSWSDKSIQTQEDFRSVIRAAEDNIRQKWQNMREQIVLAHGDWSEGELKSSITGPVVFRRIEWPLPQNLLESMFNGCGFTIINIPAIVSLGDDVYDIAVAHSKMDDFDRTYSHLEREAFGEQDPLVWKHGLLRAIQKTINVYEAEGHGGWQGIERQIESQVSAYRKLEDEVRLGMMKIAGPDALGLAVSFSS